ncbi:MAG TPA: SpoIIE family protein phosphatase [Candidatus Angelobacter sp.]|nr:SpoIIE family protein phosphatase [Candidatus Angelobacter sp.]
MISLCHAVPLPDLTSVSEARRALQKVAIPLGMDEIKAGEAAIIVTEAARNAVVHGGGGQLLLAGSRRGESEETRLLILALDSGHGIADLPRAMQDGFSTGSTPGTGLGAIRRLATNFDVFSSMRGTAVCAELVQPSTRMPRLLDIAGFAVPVSGEQVCGDACHWIQSENRLAITLVDGLGHGFHAAEAAGEAVQIFQKHSTQPPAEILAYMHDALKKTRGAAAAVAEIRPLSGTITFAGVGNISAAVLSKTLSRNLVSHSGTLGHVMSRTQEFKVEWPRDAVLVMHSDGVQTRWDLSGYPGLMARSSAIIAGVLYRDFRRERDDSSVVVVKNNHTEL